MVGEVIWIVVFFSQGITNIRSPVTDLLTHKSEIPTSCKFILFTAVAIISAYVFLIAVATISMTVLLGALTGNNVTRFWFPTLGSAWRI